MPGNRRAKPAHKSGLISQYILLIASPKNAKIPGFTPFSVSWDKDIQLALAAARRPSARG